MGTAPERSLTWSTLVAIFLSRNQTLQTLSRLLFMFSLDLILPVQPGKVSSFQVQVSVVAPEKCLSAVLLWNNSVCFCRKMQQRDDKGGDIDYRATECKGRDTDSRISYGVYHGERCENLSLKNGVAMSSLSLFAWLEQNPLTRQANRQLGVCI